MTPPCHVKEHKLRAKSFNSRYQHKDSALATGKLCALIIAEAVVMHCCYRLCPSSLAGNGGATFQSGMPESALDSHACSERPSV